MDGILDFLTQLYDEFCVSAAFLNVVVKDASLLDQLKVFLYLNDVRVNAINFSLPFNWVEARNKNLFFLRFFKQLSLVLLRVKEIDLSLLDPGWHRFLVESSFDLLDEDAIELLRSFEVGGFLISVVWVIVISWENWQLELIVPAVQLNVKQLIDDMANSLSIAHDEVLRLAVLGALGPELFNISDQLRQCVCQVALEVLEWYEYAKFLRLNANKNDLGSPGCLPFLCPSTAASTPYHRCS